MKERECDLVACIVQGLTLMGYVVLRVGQWRSDRAGTTAGTPDILVTREGWGYLIGLEVKTKTGRLSPEQKRLSEMGVTCVVRSWDEAKEVVEGSESLWGRIR